MKLRTALTCAASLWVLGCGAGTMDPTTDGIDAGKKDDPGAFAPAADPADTSKADPERADPAPTEPEEDASAIDTGTAAPAEEPVDSGTAVDPASPPDSSAPDTKVADSSVPDTKVVDSSAPDTKVADTSVADTSVADTSVADTKVADTSVADTPVTSAWRTANLTTFTSYPDPGSEECIKYSGCTWAGQFAALSSKQPESWVKANNIAAVHGKDFEAYKLKTLRLRQGTKEIDVKVYDMCADSDCSGCCTANSKSTGFLIDIEKYTAERFGASSGIVEWTCLDC